MKTIKFLLAMVSVLALADVSAEPARTAQVFSHEVPAAVAEFGLSPVGRLSATNRLNLAISLPLRNRAALDALLERQYDPANADFHQWLTPREFAERFGPSREDYEAVAQWAEAHRLVVTQRHPNRAVLDVAGSVADIDDAFHTHLQVYPHPTEARTFYGPDSAPSLDLEAPVSGISGLDNFAEPRPGARALGKESNAQPNAGSGPSGAYEGYDFRAAYVPGTLLTGAGQSVGLVQFDGYHPADIAYYVASNNLPGVTLSNVLLDGFSGTPTGNGNELEVSLDIEMTLSMAPGLSTLYLYEAGPSGLWIDILNRMAEDDLANQLSCSWFLAGAPPNTNADQVLLQMAAQGQSFFNASGDVNAYCGSVNFPCDNAYMTQVGGTTLGTTGPGGAWTSEVVWNFYNQNIHRNSGSGGGVSPYYELPAWQQGVSMAANRGSTTMRNLPDVAAVANEIYVRVDSNDYTVAGTSCGAPLWAGFCALVNQAAAANARNPVGFLNPAIYHIGTNGAAAAYTNCFHDITSGNNTNTTCGPTNFPAVAGYDLATGWGTPSTGLINALGGPIDALLVTPAAGFSSTGAVAGPFSIPSGSLTLTNAGSNAFAWTVTKTSLWLNVSASRGALIPGGPATILAVGLNSVASNLAVGTYSAVLWFTNLNNGFGQSRVFNLSVINPPTILVQPTNQVALDGATATFTVGLGGGLPIACQWQVNSNNLTDGGRISGSATPTLVISNVVPSDAASYRVIATNFAGMASSTNALLVVKPGGVDHFAWGGVPSPQYYNLPFAANITALDTADVVVSNFSGSIALNGGIVTVTTNRMFNGIGASGSGTATYTWGFPFTPTNNLLVTHVRTTFGTKVSIWTGGGVLLASQSVVSSNGAWTETPLTLPVPLVAGSNYLVAAYVPAGFYDWVTSVNGGFPDGSIGTSVYITSDAFPTNPDPGLWPLVGLRYTVTTVSPVPINPVNAGPFVNGVWNGNVTVLQTTTNASVEASDSAGHVGWSNPFSVVFSNQPPLITAQPLGQTVLPGTNVTFAVSAVGSLPLGYAWLLNGAPIAGAANASYTITNVQTSVSGSRFSCLVSNAFGSLLSSNGVLIVAAGVAHLITFDDLTGSDLAVPPGYAGMTWSNFNYSAGADEANSGFMAGMVSTPNVGYNAFGSPANLGSTQSFSLVSAYLTAAWNDNLVLEARGYSGPSLRYDSTNVLSATEPTLIDFDYAAISGVEFISSGGTQHETYSGAGTEFVIDNITVLTGTVPPKLQLVPAGFTNCAFTFLITGPAGASFVLQSSPDLRNWSTVFSYTMPAGGSLVFVDPYACTSTGRFYRAGSSAVPQVAVGARKPVLVAPTGGVIVLPPVTRVR